MPLVDIWFATVSRWGVSPERKRTIDSKGSKRSVNGLPRVHPSMTMKLQMGSVQCHDASHIHVRNDEKRNLLSIRTENQ